jgi:hypothetical protein
MTDRAHLVVILALVVVLVAILQLLRRGHLRGKYALLWLTVGLAMVPIAAFPDVVTWIARTVGVFYEPAIIIFAVLGFLLLVSMHYSWELSRLEERARTLAEEVALLRNELAVLRGSSQDDQPVGDERGESPD